MASIIRTLVPAVALEKDEKPPQAGDEKDGSSSDRHESGSEHRGVRGGLRDSEAGQKSRILSNAPGGLLCRTRAWGGFARMVILPWGFKARELAGEVLEVGSGSGATAAEILRHFPLVRLTATDYDPS